MDDLCQDISCDHSDNSAKTCQHNRLRQKLRQDAAFLGSDRLFQSYLARSLGYRYQHDVHNADTADQKRNTCDPDQLRVHRGTGTLDLCCKFQHIRCFVFYIVFFYIHIAIQDICTFLSDFCHRLGG